MFDQISFGTILKGFRRIHGKTTFDMAAALDMDRSNYSKWENGHMAPPHTRAGVVRIAQAVGCTSAETETLCMAAWEFHLDRVSEKFENK